MNKLPDCCANCPLNYDCVSCDGSADICFEFDDDLESGRKEGCPLVEVDELPSAQPEIKPISYQDCADAMMMMWTDNVLTDGEYRRIMDKLNNHNCKKMPLPEPYKGEQK